MTSVGKMADVAGSNPTSGTYRYYTHDHLGSTRALWSQAKASLGTYEYTPYGRTYWTSGPAISHKYTGHMGDSTAQLYYAPYRYYSPATARWITRDPLGMIDGPNMYAYVTGNPVTGIDSLGLSGSCKDLRLSAQLLCFAALTTIIAGIGGSAACWTGCAGLCIVSGVFMLGLSCIICVAACLLASVATSWIPRLAYKACRDAVQRYAD